MDISLDTFKELGLATVEKTTQKKQELGQEAFLEIMTTQLQHQNPLNPMENADFMSQMAQFSTVTGIQGLQKSFGDFAGSIASDQALQAASLVGRFVTAPVDSGVLSAGGAVTGEIELPQSSPNVSVSIINPSTGEVVKKVELGAQGSGRVPFEWDGIANDGLLANPGVYKIQAEARIDGTNTQLKTLVNSRVDSVTMGNGQKSLQVNLAGVGPVSFNQLTKIL
ncbi:MAG: flagellar hook assembly protein FlgD [Gammaproteobacteria bacterium]